MHPEPGHTASVWAQLLLLWASISRAESAAEATGMTHRDVIVQMDQGLQPELQWWPESLVARRMPWRPRRTDEKDGPVSPGALFFACHSAKTQGAVE